MSSSKLLFFFLLWVQSLKVAHSFLTFPCFASQGGTSKGTWRHCPLLFIPTLTYFFAPRLCLSSVDIFKRGAILGEMANRCGTGSTHARLSRAEVTTSYVSSPDVLLTVIDFNLFIFTLRSPTPRPSTFSQQSSNCTRVRHWFAEILHSIQLSFFS